MDALHVSCFSIQQAYSEIEHYIDAGTDIIFNPTKNLDAIKIVPETTTDGSDEFIFTVDIYGCFIVLGIHAEFNVKIWK